MITGTPSLLRFNELHFIFRHSYLATYHFSNWVSHMAAQIECSGQIRGKLWVVLVAWGDGGSEGPGREERRALPRLARDWRRGRGEDHRLHVFPAIS